MKTPEELAEDHANMRCPEQGPEFIVWCMCKDDFLTGYQAAREKRGNNISKEIVIPDLTEEQCDAVEETIDRTYEVAYEAGYQAAKDEYKVAIDAYNNVAKQMLHEAVRIMTPTHEIAEDVLGACNVPEKPDGWISVKDRLPEEDVEVLFFSPKTEFNCFFVGYRPKKDAYVDPEGNGLMPRIIEKYYTHWMPLPKPPEE